MGAQTGKEGVEFALHAGTAKAQQGDQERGQWQLTCAGKGLGVIGAARHLGKGRAVQVSGKLAQDMPCKITVLGQRTSQSKNKTNKIKDLRILPA